MHPSSLFYTDEFKAFIKELKGKGHLRNVQPLKHLDRIVYDGLIWSILWLCMVWIAHTILKIKMGGYTALIISCCFAALIIFIQYLIVSYVVRKKIDYEIIPYTQRKRQDAIVTWTALARPRIMLYRYFLIDAYQMGKPKWLSKHLQLDIKKVLGKDVRYSVFRVYWIYRLDESNDVYAYALRRGVYDKYGLLIDDAPLEGDKIQVCFNPKDRTKNAIYFSVLNPEFSLVSAPPQKIV